MRLEEISTYRNMLRVNKHRLDDELEVHAEVMDRIGQQMTLANSREIEAKDELGRTEDRLFRLFKASGEKVTDTQATAEAKQHKDRTSAWEAWQLARATNQEWAILYECWKDKGYSLKELGALYGAQYFAINSVTRKDTPDNYTRVSRHSEPVPEPEQQPQRRRARQT